MIGVKKLSESGSTLGHYTGKTELKLDSLRFLPITKLQGHSAFCIRGSVVYKILLPQSYNYVNNSSNAAHNLNLAEGVVKSVKVW